MAIWQTPLYTSQVPGLGVSEAVNYPLAKNARGKLRIVDALYAISAGATEAANDLIYLTMLQPGDRLIPALSKLTAENPGTTLTLEVGDTVTANRYSGTFTLSNTVTDVFFSSQPVTGTYTTSDVALPVYGTPSVPPPTATDQTIVIAKILTAAALTATKRLLFLLAIVGE
jgi:hypothetical protein